MLVVQPDLGPHAGPQKRKHLNVNNIILTFNSIAMMAKTLVLKVMGSCFLSVEFNLFNIFKYIKDSKIYGYSSVGERQVDK